MLHCKGPDLVKGVQMEGLRALGRPEAFADRYYQDGADELVFIDTVASLYRRDTLIQIVERVAGQVFIPLTVGGGVRSVVDARSLLRSGADKIAVNTAAVYHPELLDDLAAAFGCQCVVLYVEAMRRDGWWEVMTDNGRERSGREVGTWIREAQERGIGEVLLCSVDRDGTGQGYDLGLLRRVLGLTRVPVVVLGGAGCWEHLHAAAEEGADGMAAASLFHYAVAREMMQENRPPEGNEEWLIGERGGWNKIDPRTVRSTKVHLLKKGLSIRPDVPGAEGVG